MKISTMIKAAAREVGIDVRRYNPRNSDGAKICKLLGHFGIDLVLDVGANEGQYARMLRENGYRGGILSFEPLMAAHQKLVAGSAGDDGWKVAPRAAVSDQAGEVLINVSANSVSSSVLPMLQSHLAAAPGSQYVGSESVPTVRLDDVARASVERARRVYLKIDTQGHEHAVLQGAAGILPRVCGIQIELSMIPLYEGQKLYLETIQMLLAQGFDMWGLLPGFMDMATGRQLQADGIFFRAAESRQAGLDRPSAS